VGPVFASSAQGGENASTNIKAVAHPGIQMQLGVDPGIAERIEPALIDEGAFECRAISQFREYDRKSDRTDLRMMRIRHDVLAVKRDGGRDQLRRYSFPERERLRRR